MPFEGGGLATIGIASAAPKVIACVTQGIKASRVKLQDNTPAALREKLALDRQAAISGQLPGLGMQQNRLGMVQGRYKTLAWGPLPARTSWPPPGPLTPGAKRGRCSLACRASSTTTGRGACSAPT